MEIKELRVQIEQESVDYLKTVFDDYIEVYNPIEEIQGRCIIHIYPKHDTYNIEGELNGYIDAILCDMHIYDLNNKVVYKTRYHDSILLNVPCETRIFKDLSTMLIIDGGVEIVYGTGLSVYKL